MQKWTRRLLVPVLASVFVLTGFAAQHTTASAYGAADAPLAQIEVSGNCDNPTFDFCKNVVGTGGIWFWVEVDANGSGDVAGSICYHNADGVHGQSGAFPIAGEVSWDPYTGSANPALGDFFGVTDPNGSYYNVHTPLGEWYLPTTPGHYSWHPVPGVTVQLQVAP